MPQAKDLSFFRNIDEHPSLPRPPISDHAAAAEALGGLVYEATSSRLEAGCDNSSPLGFILDYGTMLTALGRIRTMAKELDAASEKTALRIFALLNALLAEARECGIPSHDLPRLEALALAYLEIVDR